MSLKAEKVLMDFLFVLHETIFIQANNITQSSDDEIEIENKYLGMQVDKFWVVLNREWELGIQCKIISKYLSLKVSL